MSSELSSKFPCDRFSADLVIFPSIFDIKYEIKRRAFRNKKPSDFIPRVGGGKGYSGSVKAKITTNKSKYHSDLRRFNEGLTDRDPRKRK